MKRGWDILMIRWKIFSGSLPGRIIPENKEITIDDGI